MEINCQFVCRRPLSNISIY